MMAPNGIVIRGFQREADFHRVGAICFAIGNASSIGMAPRAMRCERSSPFDQLHDERGEVACLLEAVDRPDVRMVEGREHFRFALKARKAIRVAGQRGG
jgi:hypothetical protein